MAKRPCSVCGTVRYASPSSRPEIICQPCRRKAREAAQAAKPKRARKRQEFQCEHCTGTFSRKRGGRDDMRFCGRKCADLAKRTRPVIWEWRCLLIETNCTRCGTVLISRNGRTTCPRGTCPGRAVTCECGRSFVHPVVAGVQLRHCDECRDKRDRAAKYAYKARRRQAGTAPPTKHRRRARHYGVAYVPVKPIEIYTRDGWMCGICGDAIDNTLPANDNWAPSLDHIVAMANGGPHNPDNLQAAHRWCNSVKSHTDLSLKVA